MTYPKIDMTTRETIISRGAELIHANGFNYTGINEILKNANVPKGSFYFYFKNKEQFGCAIIDYFGLYVGGIFDRYLGDRSVKPMERFENLFQFYTRYFEWTGYTLGCPIGNLSMELADLSADSRTHLNIVIENLILRIESCVKDAVDDKSVPARINPGDAARFIFYGFEGAILHLKVLKNTSPLNTFKKCLYDYLQYTEHGREKDGKRNM